MTEWIEENMELVIGISAALSVLQVRLTGTHTHSESLHRLSSNNSHCPVKYKKHALLHDNRSDLSACTLLILVLLSLIHI